LSYWDNVFAKQRNEETTISTKDFSIRLSGDSKLHFYRCKKCGKVTPYYCKEFCSSVKCDGSLEKYDPTIDLQNNHYANLYRDTRMSPLFIKEHTAQLAKDQQTIYQQGFVNGKINALSCSTTFEMGVDVGSLETVYMLRDHLNQQYKSGLLKKDFENVDFMTISALAYKVAGDMNGLEDLEQWLSDCYDKKEVFGYKHVIVDEGQDFGLLGVDDSANEDSSYGCQIIDILELVALGNGGTFYLFCDRNQIVQGAGADAQLPACISDSECKLTLHRNCRNTYEIATTSIKPLPKNDRNITAKQGPKSGIKPHMYAIANSDEQIEYINKAIDSLKDTCESITILSVKNTLNNSILSPYTECESVGDYSRHYTHKGKECLFSNCSKFKGLEADAIILIDVDSSTFDKGAMYFYVGASRARRNLEIISNATKEDCALMVRSLNPKAPLRRDPISMLKVLLSCDVDLIE